MSAPLVLTRPARTTAQATRLTRSTTGATPPRPMPPDDDGERIAATATSLAIACLEIFSGVRRSDTIARWVDQELLEKIDRRAQVRAEIAPTRPVRDHAAERTLTAGRSRVCRVAETVAEVTVMVRTPARYRAVAIRLELLTNRWTMTALQTM
ncbi:hypothetical protein GCM10009700_21590 [Brevibacterium sanguinis]|uniref:Rv3235 family protein n=1 Tax=Brevibacterium sanguinis TaxID=232444 RepID=UPI0031DE7E84